MGITDRRGEATFGQDQLLMASRPNNIAADLD